MDNCFEAAAIQWAVNELEHEAILSSFNDQSRIQCCAESADSTWGKALNRKKWKHLAAGIWCCGVPSEIFTIA